MEGRTKAWHSFCSLCSLSLCAMLTCALISLYTNSILAYLPFLFILYPLFTLKRNKECNASYKQHNGQYYAILAASNGHFSRGRSGYV